MKKIENLAKNTTLAILVFVIVFGAVASFFPSFNMDGYVKLLQAYAPLYGTLIVSIGANSAMQKIKGSKDAKSQTQKNDTVDTYSM
jgi:DNA-binding sugar fermentation-stimulating protein